MDLSGIFNTFLEGSVDRVIYWDYILNRRFFIYCSLATLKRAGIGASRERGVTLTMHSIDVAAPKAVNPAV